MQYVEYDLNSMKEDVGIISNSIFPYVRHSLSKPINPLVGIVIEDPILERGTLYDDILNFL